MADSPNSETRADGNTGGSRRSGNDGGGRQRQNSRNESRSSGNARNDNNRNDSRNDNSRNDGGRGKDNNRSRSDSNRSSRSSRSRGGSRQDSSGNGQAKTSKPKIGDSRPAPSSSDGRSSDRSSSQKGSSTKDSSGRGSSDNNSSDGRSSSNRGSSEGGNRNRNRRRGGSSGNSSGGGNAQKQDSGSQGGSSGSSSSRRRRRGGRGRGKKPQTAQADFDNAPIELDEETLARRRGKERDGRPIGRYLMAVHVEGDVRHIAILEGRSLIEYYVSRPTDDATQIHGNIYLGRVQNVLPGMEAAFVDITTPKNAVLYQGDVQYDPSDFEGSGGRVRIEQLLKPKQMIMCQVTKNPIAHKGARLTQEVSLPGRFVVLVPNSTTYGISKRLSDKERSRLRKILDRVKPKQHGVIVRTAAEDVTSEELERDMNRLLNQWERVNELANAGGPARLLYREPDLAVRMIREEFTKEFRGVMIDDTTLHEDINGYVNSVTPALVDRIEYYDTNAEQIPLFERYHVHEQLHKALDKKVWLPSGGSLIIEHTEALTVIDVNTGKNVGKSNLEDTVFQNNLEAAREVARQLRLRDIGGIIVIDFVDMENRKNRAEVVRVFREALARDKTRTQVFDISDLGLVEMTRKRIGEGLVESMTTSCPVCEGNGRNLDEELGVFH